MTSRLFRSICAMRDLFGMAAPEAVEAIGKVYIDEGKLRSVYECSTLSSEADNFVLYRIIGNDLPPRHERGQSLRSLRFILENEPALEACEKHFVVNRIVDTAMEAEIIELLNLHA